MTLTIHDCLQRSDEWFAARRGIVTASLVGKLITTGSPDATTVDCQTCRSVAGNPCYSLAATKGDPKPIKTIHDARVAAAGDLPPVYVPADNDTSRAITAALVVERIAGITDDSFISSDMWRGIDTEPVAREFYAKHNETPVEEVGLMVEDRWGFRIGYSPDGLVGDDGLLEVKAPRGKGHLLTVIDGEVPAYNMAQLQTGLLVSGRKWIDFVPYVGGMPMWVKRVEPDPAWQDAIVAAVAKFETTAADMVAAYTEATEGLPLAECVPNPNIVELKLA